MYLFVVPVQSTTRSSKQIKIPSTTTSITTIPSRSVNKQSNKSPPLSLASSENLNPANIHRADTKSNRSNPPIVVVPSERSRVRNSGIARNQGPNRRAVPRGSPDPARRRRGRLRRRAEGSGGGGETQPRSGVAVNKEEKKIRAVCPSGEGGQEEAGTAIYNENRQAEEVRSRERGGGPGGPPARSDQDLNAFPIRPGPRVSGTRRVRRRGRRGNDTWWTGGTTQGHNGGRDFFLLLLGMCGRYFAILVDFSVRTFPSVQGPPIGLTPPGTRGKPFPLSMALLRHTTCHCRRDLSSNCPRVRPSSGAVLLKRLKTERDGKKKET
jgi:hypothetical protein